MSAPERDPPPPASRGLSVEAAERPAGELLSELPWEGLPLDPDALTAADFLASL